MNPIDRSLSTEGLSLYTELGVEKEATSSQIKRAYHKKALRCHPDKAGSENKEAAEQFRRINRANNILQDERKRKIYNKMGSQGIAMVDHMGIEVVETYGKYDKWYYKVCCLLSCLATGCCFGCFCCCCCCLCCCGKLKPNIDETADDDEQELHTAGESESDKDSSGNNTTSAQPMGPPPAYTSQPTSNDTPIGRQSPPVVIAMPPPDKS